ncbi:MAG: PQQ-binding-like beta-propeller repeat protein, partial [Planctomycetia bacterium]|nr:PQQ-binding-like beta-propeller repeat protein [Planctomycetia bacterium]
MRPRTHSLHGTTRGRFLISLVAAAGAVLSLGVFSAGAAAEDWPTYQHDAARSGVTSDPVKPPLTPCWVFQPRDKPQPAWGDPKPEPVEDVLELRRAHFDDVFHVVVADGAVFFGSSANGKVYCLDAATGKIRWTALTDGPVRLAPMIVDGRAYVGSDDGRVYCLDAKDGSTVWKLRASPEDRWVLGSGKMISLYPVRTGVLVDGGTAYFAGGIFPTEGVFLHAADARDGKPLWQRDSFCEHAWESMSVSPQGYLLASASTLYAPMGRVSPAAFDRRDGRMKYMNSFGKAIGGTYALLAGKHVYTGTEEILAYDQETCDRFATFAGRKMIVAGDVAYLATDDHVIALDRQTKGAGAERWKTACPCHDALVLADGVLFAGGTDQVVAIDAASGKVLWSGKVDGKAKGLAAAAGRLLVSTDTGMIYSFGPEGSPQHGTVTEPVNDQPYAGSPHDAMFKAAAEAIVRETGAPRGYCLVLGCETGQLALELAKRTDLTIYAVSPDAEKVAAAKKTLDAAGVYGSRVSVQQWPLDNVPYSDYFANLIVSETAMLTGELPPA